MWLLTSSNDSNLELEKWPKGLIIVLTNISQWYLGEKKARKSVPDDDSFIAINDQVELAPDEIKQPISNSRQEQETSFDMDALEEKIEYEGGFYCLFVLFEPT